MEKKLICFILFFILSTSLLSQDYNKLHYIPDDNLRGELYKQGFTNQDSLLDESKIEGRLQLKLNNKEIKNLDGLQYFQQVWNLDIYNNIIEELKDLPPNLTHLNCSMNEIKELKDLPPKLGYLNCSQNKLETINNLPNNLKHLVCSNNLIKKIINLPDNLESLNFSDNSVTTFPVLPLSLQSINYYNNKLNINKLPKLYKNNIACDHPNQNCLPYELVNWKLLNHNIKDTVFDILELKVTINVAHSWGMGNENRTIHFIKDDNRLICKNDNRYINYGEFHGANKEPTNETKENNHSFSIEELKSFLKDLYHRKMIFEFKINNRIETINLRTKRNGYPLCSASCIDCSYYGYKYEIYTTTDTIILKYNSDFSSDNIVCGKGRSDIYDPPEYIEAILNRLYVHKLEELILNKEYSDRDYGIRNYINWEKNYK
jgi:hypothetical protein